MALLKTVTIWFSYLVHFILGLCLLAIACFKLAAAPVTLHLDMLPFSAAALDYILPAGALFGLISVALAVAGRVKILFLLWSIFVAVVLTKGYVFSGYRFGVGEARPVAYLIASAWVAVLGAWFRFRGPRDGQPKRGPRKYRMKRGYA